MTLNKFYFVPSPVRGETLRQTDGISPSNCRLPPSKQKQWRGLRHNIGVVSGRALLNMNTKAASSDVYDTFGILTLDPFL